METREEKLREAAFQYAHIKEFAESFYAGAKSQAAKDYHSQPLDMEELRSEFTKEFKDIHPLDADSETYWDWFTSRLTQKESDAVDIPNVTESVKNSGVSCFFFSKKQYNIIKLTNQDWQYPKFKGKDYTEMRCISHGFKNNFDDSILLGIGTLEDVAFQNKH